MSGSGGGGGYVPDGGNRACETLEFDATVASPQRAVVAKLKVGVVLSVQLQTSAAGQVVVALYLQTQLLGGLNSSNVVRLRECMQQGTQYEAEVKKIAGGQVTVRIRPV